MAEKKEAATTTKKKEKPKATPNPCVTATNSKKLKPHMAKRPDVDDPCYPVWQAHARFLAQKEGVQLGPI